jgi:hypothetical protein
MGPSLRVILLDRTGSPLRSSDSPPFQTFQRRHGTSIRFCGAQLFGGRKQERKYMQTKEITLKTLADLKAKLYANAAPSIAQNPTKAEAIQKRTAADAAHITFAINMVTVKM